MVMVQLNLDAFILYVEGKYFELFTRGQTDLATITHLFQGYKAASDKPFVAWIKCHHDNVDDGTTNFTAKQLMQMAMHKYANMVKNGTWVHPNDNREKIIALTGKGAKINCMLKKPADKKDKKKANNNRNNNCRQQNHLACPICKEDRWYYMPLDKDAPCTKSKKQKDIPLVPKP